MCVHLDIHSQVDLQCNTFFTLISFINIDQTESIARNRINNMKNKTSKKKYKI